MGRTLLAVRFALVSACLLGLPAGASAQKQQAETPPRAETPTAAVEKFLKAVADSDYAALAESWGSSGGPAVKSQPRDWQRRVAIMQSYLQKAEYRILGEDAAAPGGNKRTVLVEQRRSTCVHTMPFGTTKLGDGSWLVTNVDLSTGAVPGKTCESETKN